MKKPEQIIEISMTEKEARSVADMLVYLAAICRRLAAAELMAKGDEEYASKQSLISENAEICARYIATQAFMGEPVSKDKH